MEEEGLIFKCNANVGVNLSINDLLREYHAIVLAGGSTIPRDLTYSGTGFERCLFCNGIFKTTK